MSRYIKKLPPLETLIAFESVGRHGSFTQAATELYLTQSAVSKQIRQLEDSLKIQLFERKPRGVVLTPAGEELHQTTQQIFEKLQHKIIKLQKNHQPNCVTILATHALTQFWLFPKLVEFHKAYPDITVHVDAINTMDESSFIQYDLGILYGAGHWSSLRSQCLIPEVIYPVAHPDIDISQIHSLQDLAAVPLVQINASAWDCLDWKDWFQHFNMPYQIALGSPTFNQLTLAFHAVQQGMGIGLAWSFMADELVNTGKLQQVTEFKCHTGNGEFLVYEKHRKLNEAAQIFHDWLINSA
ncbi:LysR substrate-binding domain-containing protein [Acinetobacter brisouii]|uniref:LysR substrate-binding domain-containing protein n=1 Tax=Acinetobacter brisouii TaxID=396323 RepID=UPI0035B05A52